MLCAGAGTHKTPHGLVVDSRPEQDICSKQEEYDEALDIAKKVAQAYETTLGPVRVTIG